MEQLRVTDIILVILIIILMIVTMVNLGMNIQQQRTVSPGDQPDQDDHTHNDTVENVSVIEPVEFTVNITNSDETRYYDCYITVDGNSQHNVTNESINKTFIGSEIEIRINLFEISPEYIVSAALYWGNNSIIDTTYKFGDNARYSSEFDFLYVQVRLGPFNMH